MTEPERRVLRVLIDQARRRRVRRITWIEQTDPLPLAETGQRRCLYCGRTFTPSRKPENAARQRFCSLTHKSNWWRRERMAREREWKQTLEQREAVA